MNSENNNTNNEAEITAESAFLEKVVYVNRCAKVVAGGRRFSFSALCVVGNKKGKVGIGFGKAQEVSDAIRKGIEKAKKTMIEIPLYGSTIPHEVKGVNKGGKVILKPAAPGTGIKAGFCPRAVLEACGVRDVLTKSLGSNNQINVTKATLNGLLQLNSANEIFNLRRRS